MAHCLSSGGSLKQMVISGPSLKSASTVIKKELLESGQDSVCSRCWRVSVGLCPIGEELNSDITTCDHVRIVDVCMNKEA